MATKREKQYLFDHGDSLSAAQLLEPGSSASTAPSTKANSSVISLYSGSLQRGASGTVHHDPPPQYTSDDPETQVREIAPLTNGASVITVTDARKKSSCCSRCCTCCNCCGLPLARCRAAWCLIVVGLIVSAVTLGVMTIKCVAQAPVRVDQGTLELAAFKEGELRIVSAIFDSGSILIESGPAGSDVTYRVDVYSSHDPNTNPFSQTYASKSNSTWTLTPASVPGTDVWPAHMCERTVTTLTLPSDLLARGNYSLTVVAQNAGIKYIGGDSNSSWWSMSLTSMNGGIKVQSPATAPLKIHSVLSATSTNGGIAIDRLHMTRANARLKVQSMNGGVSVVLAGLPAFPQAFTASAGSTNGGVSVLVPRDASFAWTAGSTNGGVSIVGQRSSAREGEMGQGRGEGRQLSMTSVNGGVSLEVV
ncbi:hypothetical protein BCR44DRAFT_34752 [Catenaria anguillulae PL171]|uniref:Uncharacterized protein n=1 Tax=Catenaria anguillulae PL171 TaxID=765915 RepID=A0A1Y2I2D0_9FUNG|nr:hypothetical protein BCR44DRAFT_34752 [Catenaria anguillulae PL171]